MPRRLKGKMKILMLGWEFPPFRSGGLGTHCYHLTKGLSSLGIEITFLMPKNPHHIKSDYMKIIEVDPALMTGPYSFTETVDENYGWNFFDDVWKYNNLAVKYALKEKFDVIHCHDWLTSIAGIEIKRRTKKPLIVTIHSTEYDRTGSLSPNQWILDREANVMKFADLIITVSELMKKQLIERYNVDPNKIIVIYNAIDHENWAVREIERRFVNQKVVLFMGRLTIQKGPDFFLKAAKKVLEKNKDVRFVLGGRGDMLPQLIRESIAMGISDNVMFLGYVPEEELPKIYAAADVFILSSVAEPFGITALEAIAAGTPTIITKQSGVKEVVKHAFTVDFWDANEMANKILALISYPSLHKTMKENGRHEISKYTWGRVAQETIDKAYRRFSN
jgi:glycosyltransferase involved in cell wall biosynthesis